jgi:ABC-type transport system involved in multi-copper enzyme maturation permease subunit
MSATLAAAPATTQPVHSATPTFFGIVRGELFKVSKQRATWFAALVLLAVNFLPYLVEMSVGNLADRVQSLGTSGLLYNTMGNALTVFRVFVGPFLVIVTARLIGMEYSSGTIRVLLSRGVGRLQLLGAKLLAVFGIAAVTLVAGLLFHFVMSEILFATKLSSINIGQAATAQFWTDTRTYILTVAISMVATILMAAGVTVIGRSLAVGLSVGLSFFAADNIGLIFFYLAYRLTGSDFWQNVTGLLLGPNLNEMPHALLPNVPETATRALQPPLVTVDSTHTIVVAAVWCVAFLAVAAVLTWKRDVKE